MSAREYVTQLRSATGPWLKSVVRSGERLTVDVNDGDLVHTVTVRPDGCIELPDTGVVEVADKSYGEVCDLLAAKYKPYYRLAFKVRVFPVTSPPGGAAANRASLVIPGKRPIGFSIEEGDRLSDVIDRMDPDFRRTAVEAGTLSQVGVLRSFFHRNLWECDRLLIVCDMEKFTKHGDAQEDLVICYRDSVVTPTFAEALVEEVLDHLHQTTESQWRVSYGQRGKDRQSSPSEVPSTPH